jgi:mRNA interferase RelE/StbE
VRYELAWRALAADHFRKLEKPARKLVASKIELLADNPRPANLKPVIGMPGVLLIRAGDYRVLYTVDDEKQQIWIEDVRNRRDAYGGH